VSKEKGIFVVADGFGGPIPGGLAAKMACEAVWEFLVKEVGDPDVTFPFVLKTYYSLAGNVLFNALVYANRKLLKFNQGKNVNERGGASVVAGFLDGELLALANVGGCEARLLRKGNFTRIITPRTYAQLLDPQIDNPADEHRIPLTALGMAEDLDPEIYELRVRPEDALLLHTDGLEAEARQDLLRTWNEPGDVSGRMEKVLAALGRHPGRDNVAAALVVL